VSYTFKVLLADDDAEDVKERVQSSLRRALKIIAPTAQIQLDAVDDREEALNLLAAPEPLYDLALIDLYWVSILEGEERDAASTLLRTALRITTTSTVLISIDAALLIDYLYNEDRSEYRPHAVLAKGHLNNEEIVGGVLAAAFSAKRLPLRSAGVRTTWDLGQAPARNPFASVRTIVEELACAALPRDREVANLRVTPIGGGMSDALTVLVEATLGGPAGTRRLPMMLKLAQDPETLAAEARNQETEVTLFPAGTFARLLGRHELEFAGWSALAFEQIEGRTASALGGELLEEGRWGQLFSQTLLRFYASNSQPGPLVPAMWIGGESGLLTAGRWTRPIARLADFVLEEEDAQLIRQGAAALFTSVQRQSAFGLVHGDLHARNVLVRPDGGLFLVDAASIRTQALWCEDVARFSVWLAAELLQKQIASGGVRNLVNALGRSLALTGVRPPQSTWPGRLRSRVDATLHACEQLWEERKVHLDVHADWRLAVCAELLRVSYSADSFDAQVRGIAASAAVKWRE
jgi:hypothetical protein